jgi:hypothetical protein
MTAPLVAAVSLALCPVTVPNPALPPAGEHFNYGNDRIRAELYRPNGTLLAGVLPDGGVMATVGRPQLRRPRQEGPEVHARARARVTLRDTPGAAPGTSSLGVGGTVV